MSQNQSTIKFRQPNPLFEKWLTEWRDEERRKGSRKENSFNKALESLRKYPLPLLKGKDCLVLEGFGQIICQMLDDKLNAHQINNSTEITIPIQNETALNNKKSPTARPKTSPTKKGEYNPLVNSGPYNILIALNKCELEPNSRRFFYKEDIIAIIKSFSNRDIADSSYTSSLRTLISKHLVNKDSNPPKFSLTEDGKVIAHRLYEKLDDEIKAEVIETVLQSEVKLMDQKSVSMQSETTETDIIMCTNSFQIFLLVDTQEIAGKSHKDEIIFELKRFNTLYEIRHLTVGDYAWVCRDIETGVELILPYIIERKRMDDLGASIKDGRFHEQKFRLKQSGIQNLIYLVESHGSNNHTGLPLSTLYQAAANTLIQDGFCVKFTENLRDTIRYLVDFTNILSNVYKRKTLIGCNKNNIVKSSLQDDMISLMSFKEFNQNALKAKNLKVHDFFVKQLLQIKGVSVDRALAITKVYPTPRILKNKYREGSPSDGETLLSNIPFGKLGKNIGSVISKSVYQLYSFRQY